MLGEIARTQRRGSEENYHGGTIQAGFNISFVVFLSLIALLPSACSKGRGGAALAKVGGVKISESDFQDYLSTRAGANLTDDQKRALLDQLVDEVIFAEEAESGGLDKDPKIQGELDRYRRQVLSRAMQEKLVADKLSDDKLKEYYEGHKGEFTQRLVSIRKIVFHISDSKSQSAVEAAEKKAREAARRASKGEDFAALARSLSEDPESRAKGGLTGWTGPSGQMPPQVYVQALRMSPGQTSEPIRARDAFYVIRSEEPTKEITTEFEDAMETIRMRQRWQVLSEQKEALRKKHKVEIHTASATTSSEKRKEDR